MQNSFTSNLVRFFLLTFFVVASTSGCRKEKMDPFDSSPLQKDLSKFAMPSGAHLVASPAGEPDGTMPGGLEERDNDYNHQKRPNFPFYDGRCRLIFRVYGFNPSVPHGGFNPPCSFSGITFKGYSAPNGQGTLLFTQDFSLTGGWQILEVPQSCYIQFKIGQTALQGGGGSDGPCKFKFVTGEYGWNRSAWEWGNISYNEWLPVIMGRFAPKDPSTYGNYFDEYLCSPWCTWSAPVTYLPSDDPWDNQWTTTRLACFYGPAPTYINSFDPRLIKDHFIYEKIEQTVYLYPIETSGTHYYATKAQDLGYDDNDFINYWVLGANGNGHGPFGWGVAGDFQLRLGCNLTLAHHE